MKNDLKRTIGLRIRTARKSIGLTQDELSERIDRSVETVSNLERGRTLPPLPTLVDIAQILNLPISELLADIDQDNHDSRERIELLGTINNTCRQLNIETLRIAAKQMEALSAKGQ